MSFGSRKEKARAEAEARAARMQAAEARLAEVAVVIPRRAGGAALAGTAPVETDSAESDGTMRLVPYTPGASASASTAQPTSVPAPESTDLHSLPPSEYPADFSAIESAESAKSARSSGYLTPSVTLRASTPAGAGDTAAGHTTVGDSRLRDTLIRRPSSPLEWLLLALAVVLLLTILLPPMLNLGRYRGRVEANLSRSLGREVTMRGLNLRLMPVPALVLTDVVVHESVAFGAEPALRAPSVLAELRLASLWRGHLEISRVALSDASLNLVRDASGRWNAGSILLQASQVPNAPTAQPHSGPTPRFPYIEITDSRVNVKQGVEKLPYSLLNANLSMWLDAPEIWQIRLDGQPVRTDIELGLSDTGTLRVEGSLHRATALGKMPIALHGDWEHAPLGQASRLLLGHDPGWRGEMHANADLAGDLDNLSIKTHIEVANLHREEFTPSEPLAVDATCRAAYSRATALLSDLHCRWPVGNGQLLLAGSLGTGASPALAAAQPSTLALTVQQLPASFLLAAVGLARSDFAPVFHVDGTLSGMLFYTANPDNAPVYAGVLEATPLSLSAAGMEKPLELTGARLTAEMPSPTGASGLSVTTAPVDLGGPEPVSLHAQISPSGFLLQAAGSASVGRLQELGRATRTLPTALTWLTPDGTAEFDVARTSAWQPRDAAGPPVALPPLQAPAASMGPETAEPPKTRRANAQAQAAHRSGRRSRRGHPTLAAPAEYETDSVTEGWLRLRNAVYRPPFLAEPVMLPAAEAKFLPGAIDWSVPAAVFHRMSLAVNARYPLDCAAAEPCVTQFRADTAGLDAEVLQAALLGSDADRHLLDQLLSRPDSQPWPSLAGTLHADVFTLGPLGLHNVDAVLSEALGRLTLSSFDAQALGGSMHGEGQIEVAGGVPHYRLTTSLTKVSASAAGALFRENWGAGTITAHSRMELAGVNAQELAGSATGEFAAEWLHGGLGGGFGGGTVGEGQSAPTPFARFAAWTAAGRIADHALTLTKSRLSNASGEPLSVEGSIGLDRKLALKVGPVGDAKAQSAEQVQQASSESVTVAGTLSHPAN